MTTQPVRPLRSWFSVFAFLIFACGSLFAADAEKKSFDIPAGTADDALRTFSAQSSIEVVYPSPLVEGVSTMGVKGELTPSEALKQLLAGTGLVAKQNKKTGAYSLVGELDPNVNRAIAQSSDRPSKSQKADNSSDTEGVVKLDTFEVFGRKTLNMDIQRTRDDVLPYMVFDNAQIRVSGALNLEDFFRKRLSAISTFSSNSQGAVMDGNASSISLRGLSAGQTLILVDGHRAASQSRLGIAIQPDINAIPLASIERVEVLPASASGIYGGDATAGVINIILKRNYSGVDLAVGYESPFARGGGATAQLDFTAGLPINPQTHLTINASYSKRTPLLTRDRSFYSRSIITQLAVNPASIDSAVVPPLGATSNIVTLNGAPLALKSAFGGMVLPSSHTYVPLGYGGVGQDGVAGLVTNAGKYNLELADTAQTGGGRSILFSGSSVEAVRGTLRHDFSEKLTAFTELSASRNHASYPVSQVSTFFTVPQAAPTNPFNQDIRVTVPAVGADQELVTDIDDFRLVTGCSIKLPLDLKMETDLTLDLNRFSNTTPGAGIASTATQAISSGALDFLRDVNKFPLPLSQYLLPQSEIPPTYTRFGDIALRVGGPLATLKAGPIIFSSAVEFRVQSIGDSEIVPSPTSKTVYPSREQSAGSAYLEFRVPILGSMERNHPMLEAQLSGRFDSYRTQGSNSYTITNGVPSGAPTDAVNEFHSIKPTAGLRFQPCRDIAIRCSYSEGFLPPSVSQLVPNPTTTASGASLRDPKRGNEQLGTYTRYTGGNPDLRPEESVSKSVGIIFTPRFVPNLRVSLDAISIVKKDALRAAVGFPASQSVLNNEDLLPGAIIRNPDPATFGPYGVGPVTAIDGRLLNITRQELTAIDYSVDYTITNVVGGKLNILGSATRQPSLRTQNTPAAAINNTAGVLSTIWTANGQISWTRGDLSVAWSSQYIDKLWFASDHTPNANTGATRYGGYLLHDIALELRIPSRKKWSCDFQAGLANVFNEQGDVVFSVGDGRISPLLARYWIKANLHF